MEKFMETFRKNQEALATEHHGKYVLINAEGILGTFHSDVDAYWDAVDERHLVPGNFLIHPCCFRKDERPVMFYSNVE